MSCGCETETKQLRIEGDFSADAVWCDECLFNLETEDLPLSNEIKNELKEWAWRYGEWMNWDTETLLPGGVEQEEAHNEQGRQLTERVKEALGDEYYVGFSPSSSARSHAAADERKGGR